ncbi:hypothetical protein JL721_4602 [Aureococcus anophagefferens]|nr:hypothetical protein JL721_4602 [Aureococcus anophagefferens]
MVPLRSAMLGRSMRRVRRPPLCQRPITTNFPGGGFKKMVDKVPLVWSASAVYAGVGLAASSYYLVTLDASEACYKCRTDAWGAARQLEGLDELLGWLEWSATGVGADVAPKLVAAFGAERCAVAGLASAVEDVRSASAGALAALTHDDELARRVARRRRAVAAPAASARRAAAASAALTALYGARGFRYEARRSFFAEGDAAQIALSATVVSADLAVLFVALRVAPFCVFPFLVANVLA